MKAGTTDVDVSTRVMITGINAADIRSESLIGMTGIITHPFPGAMDSESTYIAGIYLDQQDIFLDNIANLIEGDGFKVLQNDHEFKRGFKAALQMYAFWNHGKEYVGTTGTTLRDALYKANSAPIEKLRAWGDLACAPEK